MLYIRYYRYCAVGTKSSHNTTPYSTVKGQWRHTYVFFLEKFCNILFKTLYSSGPVPPGMWGNVVSFRWNLIAKAIPYLRTHTTYIVIKLDTIPFTLGGQAGKSTIPTTPTKIHPDNRISDDAAASQDKNITHPTLCRAS